MLLLLLLLLVVLCLYRVVIQKGGGYHHDYLSKSKTNSIKGIFIMIVVMTHSMGYFRELGYHYDAFGDSLFKSILSSMGQLVVVMFLFYSGYGVMESFKLKGKNYVKPFPRRRILTTLLNYDVAVVMFFFLGLLLGRSTSLSHFLLALTGWESLGNSNWYIFVVLLCYALTWVVLSLPLTRNRDRVALLFAACCVCLMVLSFYKEECWSDTILSFPAGFLYSTYKESIEQYIKRHYWPVLAVLTLLLVVQFIGYYYRKDIYVQRDVINIMFNLQSITFALWVVVLTMKVGIGNAPLEWLGRHLFPIYIYMRIPMLALVTKQPEFVLAHPSAFIVISLAITLVIAKLYHYWQIKLS